MAFQPEVVAQCKALQENYVDYFGQNAAEFRNLEDVSLLRWLLSPQNTAGFKQISLGIQGVPGKKRPVAFRYDDPMCFTVCAPVVNCATPRIVYHPGTKERTYYLEGEPFRPCDGTGKPMVLSFTEDELAVHCTETDRSYIDRKIVKFLRRFETELNKKILTLLLPYVGTNAAGASKTQIPFFVKNTTTNSSAMNPDAIWYLDQTWGDAGNKGQYGVLGGKIVSKIETFMKWQGLNDAGIDLSEVGDMSPYSFYSRDADSLMGLDEFLLLAPGSAQLIYWNKYKGEKRRSVTELYIKDTVMSPLTGLEIDFFWKYDPDCEIYSFEPFVYLDLVSNLPGGCSPLGTTNGMLRIKDCSGVGLIPTCPAPEA